MLNASEKFMAEYFASLHYDLDSRLDNCTYKYTATDQYVPYHLMSGRTVCSGDNYRTDFCECVRWVRSQYEFEVEKSLKQLAQFLVTLKNDHGFDGEFNKFDYKWTLPNAVLFTMTTLTSTPSDGESTKRIAFESPTTETATGGNGLLGHDETSEDITTTWEDTPYSAADPFVCDLP